MGLGAPTRSRLRYPPCCATGQRAYIATIRVFTANVKGLTDRLNRKTAFCNAKKIGASINILTETKALPKDFSTLRRDWGQFGQLQSLYSDCGTGAGGGRGSGVILAFKNGSLEKLNDEVVYSETGNYIIFAGKIEGFNYLIGAVYGFSGADSQSAEIYKKFKTDFTAMKARNPTDNIIVGGDFNCTLLQGDSINTNPKPKTEEILSEFIVEHDLIDIWHDIYPNEEGFTFGVETVEWNEMIKNRASRLDRIYATSNTLQDPIIWRGPFIRNKGDHLTITSDLRSIVSDPPPYKFPNHLLTSPHFIEFLHTTIREFLVVHSKLAEHYYDSHCPPQPDPPTTVNFEPLASNPDPDEYRDIKFNEIPLVYCSSNKQTSLDKSTTYQKAKLEEFLANMKQTSEFKHVKSIEELINEASYQEEPGNLLHALFNHIMEETKKYQATRNGSIRDDIKKIYKQIQKLKMRQFADPNINRNHQIQQLTARLSLLEIKLLNKDILNARINHAIQGEKANSKFLKQHKHNKSSSTIFKIVENKEINGIPATVEHIGNDATTFMQQKFNKLFSTPAKTDPDYTIEEFLGDEIQFLKTLPPHIVDMLKLPITLEELTNQVLKSHKGTAPGMSGVTYPLMACLWPHIKNVFFRFATSIFVNGTLPEFEQFRKMIIIPKPNKDRTDSESYRPIALLEISYKIISGAIADRLKLALPFLIGPSQKGFTSGRTAQEAVRAILDARDLAVSQGRRAMLIGCDLSKAFDTVSHRYLFQVMERMGFPNEIMHKIRTLIAQPKISFFINGKLSPFFDQIDGTGQGDPISSFLFNFAIEILLIKLSNSPLLTKFVYDRDSGDQLDPEAFADDVHLFLESTLENMQNLITITDNFARLSGLYLSKPKTEVMFIGPAVTITPHNNAGISKLKIVQKIKFVGVWIHPRGGDAEVMDNLEGVDKKMTNTYRAWAWRKPTPLGGALICQTLVVSQGIHIFQNFDTPPEWIRKADEILRNIVWSGGRSHIEKAKIHAPKEMGGLDLVNLDILKTSLKVFWFRKLTRCYFEDSLHYNWIKILNLHLKSLDLNVQSVTSLGCNDLKWISKKFKEKGLRFWGDTFDHFSLSARLMEQNATNWQSLPIFGGIFQENLAKHKRGGGSWLSIRNDIPHSSHSDILRVMVKHKIATISDAHKKLKDGEGSVIRSNTFDKTLHFMRNFNLENDIMIEELKSVFRTIQGGINYHTDTLKMFPVKTICKPCTLTPLQAKCMQFHTGCSFITKKLKQDLCEKHNWTHAKSWESWHKDYDLNINEKNWAKIFSHIHATKLPNSIKWHASTIIFRTCWTGVKEFLSYNREDDRYCRLCNSIEDQNTMHKYFKCPIVTKLWSHIQNFIWLNFNLLIHTDLNSLFFHQYKYKKSIDNIRVTTLICTVNYALWKIEKDGSDPNLPDYLIWNKCKVYLEWISQAMIRARHDNHFWYDLKQALENWNPRAHANDLFIAPRFPDLNRGNAIATDQFLFDPFEAWHQN